MNPNPILEPTQNMKRLFALLLLSAGAAGAALAAEQATLSANTVLRTGDSLVILKAGTTVEVLKHNEKTVTVKVGDKTGLIPWSALETAFSDADMMSVPQKAAPAPAAKSAAASASTTTPPPPAPPAAPRQAQTMYGKAVEKAAAAADSHEKAAVHPTDEILGGK
jgi:hypothetical protein